MRVLSIFAVTIAAFASNAYAATFACQGTGRFAEIGNQTVELTWKKEYQKVLLENKSLKVQVYLDESNSDGTHYVGIEVLALGKSGVTSIHSSKGSSKDMVQYFELGIDSSVVACLPLAK